MDEVRLVPIEELTETEGGGFLIPEDTLFDSVVEINGTTFAVLYKPGTGGGCMCGGDNTGFIEGTLPEFVI